MASLIQLSKRIAKLKTILCKSRVIFVIGDDSALEGVEAKEGDVIVLVTI